MGGRVAGVGSHVRHVLGGGTAPRRSSITHRGTRPERDLGRSSGTRGPLPRSVTSPCLPGRSPRLVCLGSTGSTARGLVGRHQGRGRDAPGSSLGRRRTTLESAPGDGRGGTRLPVCRFRVGGGCWVGGVHWVAPGSGSAEAAMACSSGRRCRVVRWVRSGRRPVPTVIGLLGEDALVGAFDVVDRSAGLLWPGCSGRSRRSTRRQWWRAASSGPAAALAVGGRTGLVVAGSRSGAATEGVPCGGEATCGREEGERALTWENGAFPAAFPRRFGVGGGRVG